ncbi:hypothetical protein V1502_03940 [Bacillus sp. SCS-153A]|uniref:hypothetical protein n=1 Tax=Rossellomorea sedimentorum TaxID=3115294 RepID=UPI0039059397
MIKILRSLAGLKLQQIFFPTENAMAPSKGIALTGVIQSKHAFGILSPIETLQVDLTKPEEKLFSDIKKSTRQQIRQAELKYRLVAKVNTTPDEETILNFRKFYNKFAAHKHTYKCNAFHLKTLKLLAEQNCLVITTVEDSVGETICYRVYATDGIRATSLYSAAHFRQAAEKERKRLISAGHRYLKWKDMLWFKHSGYNIYDSGGLTADPNIRNFKLEFGGEIVKEYSGYIPTSLLGKAIILIRKWKFKKELRVKT